MAARHPKVDAYIERAGDFAKPILRKIRDTFHEASSEIAEELKWGHPAFVYKGIVAGMAAFKKHVSFGFWKQKLIDDPRKLLEGVGAGMGGGRFTSVSQLPSVEDMKAFIRQAIRLNDEGVPTPAVRRDRPALDLKGPADFRAALKRSTKAAATFKRLSDSHKREYVEWIVDAKQAETRKRRIQTSIQWLSEGKPHGWRYMPQYAGSKASGGTKRAARKAGAKSKTSARRAVARGKSKTSARPAAATGRSRARRTAS